MGGDTLGESGNDPMTDKRNSLRCTSAEALLDQIGGAKPLRRFVQGWSSEDQRFSFGCGDGEQGVVVDSEGDLEVWEGGVLQTRLSREVVKRFRDDRAPVEGSGLFAQVKSVLQMYVHFDDVRLYTLIALWIIGSYLYSVFSHYGYLFLHSLVRRSGKTRVATEHEMHPSTPGTDGSA